MPRRISRGQLVELAVTLAEIRGYVTVIADAAEREFLLPRIDACLAVFGEDFAQEVRRVTHDAMEDERQ